MTGTDEERDSPLARPTCSLRRERREGVPGAVSLLGELGSDLDISGLKDF